MTKENPPWSNKKDSESLLIEQNYLTEVDKIVHDLTEFGKPQEQTIAYVRFNEKTQALETTTSEILHYTTQRWDPSVNDFVGYGVPINQISTRGVGAINTLVTPDRQELALERDRRVVELGIAQELAMRQMTNDYNVDLLHISPCPGVEEEDEHLYMELGYFMLTRTTMFKQYIPQGDGSVIVVQVAVENSDTELLSKLLSGSDVSLSELEILGRLTDIEDVGVIDFVRQYDDLLEEKYGTSFLFGRSTQEKTGDEYGAIVDRTEEIEGKTDVLIDRLVDLDLNLAHSILDGKPNDEITASINGILNANYNNSPYAPSPDQLLELRNSLTNFTRESAEIVKKLETMGIYTMIKSITASEEAKQLFGEDKVERLVNAYYQYGYGSETQLQAHQINSSKQMTYAFCGGMMTNVNLAEQAYNLLNIPFGQFKNMLQSGGGERKFIRNCGACGTNIGRVMSSGETCDSCGGTYKGC